MGSRLTVGPQYRYGQMEEFVFDDDDPGFVTIEVKSYPESNQVNTLRVRRVALEKLFEHFALQNLGAVWSGSI